MTPWAWWASGVALALVPLVNWVVLGRMLAVSGRYTALVDRFRSPPQGPEMSQAELIAAVRAATAAEFGEAAVATEAPVVQPSSAPAPRTSLSSIVFLASLALGGALSAALAGTAPSGLSLRSEAFPRIFGEAHWVTPVVLVVGGVLVGFGTRMASGCTSGHGLCGVSRAQPGSLLATCAFFAGGVALSFLLEAL